MRLLTCLSLVLALTISSAAPALAQDEPAQPTADNQAVLDKLKALSNGVKLETLSPVEARKAPTFADAVKGVLQDRGESTAPEPVADVTDRTIPGPAGDIPVRIYTPEGDGPFPVVVYYHGGGWVLADYNVYDSSGRALANAAEAIVVSVNYRRAPENPYPAAADDAYAAYIWATQNADEIDGDTARVAVAGESAGGNLAAVTALRARDEGAQMPVHQLLVYPITNYAFDTESYETYAAAMPLSRPLMQYFWRNYLTDEAEGVEAYASPLQAESLEGLPPATVVAAQIDPLQTEGAEYAEALEGAGVSVRYQLYEGTTHEFFGAGVVIPEGKAAVAFAAEGLKAGFMSMPESGGGGLAASTDGPNPALPLTGLGLLGAIGYGAFRTHRRSSRA